MDAETGFDQRSSFFSDNSLFNDSESTEETTSPGLFELVLANIINSFNDGIQSEITHSPLELAPDIRHIENIEDFAEMLILLVTDVFPIYCEQNPERDEHNSLLRFLYITHDSITTGLEETEIVLDANNVMDEYHGSFLIAVQDSCKLELSRFSEGFGFDEQISWEESTTNTTVSEEQFIDDDTLDKLLC